MRRGLHLRTWTGAQQVQAMRRVVYLGGGRGDGAKHSDGSHCHPANRSQQLRCVTSACSVCVRIGTTFASRIPQGQHNTRCVVGLILIACTVRCEHLSPHVLTDKSNGPNITSHTRSHAQPLRRFLAALAFISNSRARCTGATTSVLQPRRASAS